MKEDNIRALHSQEYISQDITVEKEQEVNQKFMQMVQRWQKATAQSIKQAKDVEYLSQTPIVMPQRGETAFLNMIIADAGGGKSLLARALIQYILDAYQDIVVLWFDLEFQEAVSKQRKVDELIERYPERFFLFNQYNIEASKELIKVRTTMATVNRIIERFQKVMPDVRFFVVVDSFEDLVEDTSNDQELKRHFADNLLNKKGISYLINHHINKDSTKSLSMRFRGSMVVKAKLTTLLYIQKKVKEDDFTSAIELVALKIRTAFPPSEKIVVRVDTNEWKLKDVAISTDTEEMKILRSIFFYLRKNKKSNKSTLITEVSNEVRKRKEKVRSVIDKYIRFFSVGKGQKREEIVSLSNNVDLIDEMCALIGMPNKTYTDKQRDLWKAISDMNDNQEINVKLKRDIGSVEYKLVKTLKNYIADLSDADVDEVLRQLQSLKLKPDGDGNGNGSRRRELTDEELAQQIVDSNLF